MTSDLISRWPPEYSFALFLVLGVSLLAAAIPVTIVATIQWRKTRQAELDHLLKQEMLARGLSADEIERILLAGRNDSTVRNT
jgi:hypothetical protein